MTGTHRKARRLAPRLTDTHRKARRLAPRALNVVARPADKPAVAAYEGSLGPKANAFIRAYDTAAKHEATGVVRWPKGAAP